MQYTTHIRVVLATLLAGILFLLGAGATAFAQDHQDWKFTHPKPQPNTLRKFRALDDNNWIAVGANGTFMRTTDAGVTWYFHHQAGVATNNAGNIGQNYDLRFVDPMNGIIVGDTGFVGTTSDGGVTITPVTSTVPTTQRCQAISFGDASTGYVAAGAASGSSGRIIKTTDGGATWATVFTATNSVASLVAINPMVVHAVLQNGGVTNTTDGGLTWSTPVAGTAVSNALGMSFLDATTGFVVGSSGSIGKSTDGGATWAHLTPPQTNFGFFQMKIISPTEIYAVGAPDFLYQSTDLGVSWTPLPIIPVSGNNGAVDTNVFYSLEKLGSTLVMAGDVGEVVRSTDGGNTWSSNNFELTTALMFDIKEVPNTSTVVAVGRQRTTMQRQVLRSTDFGNTWSAIDIPINTDLQAVSFVDSQLGYASGTNSQVVKTTDAGLTWAPVTQPTTTNFTLQAIEFVDANTGWVFINFGNNPGGNIYKTTDGGTTWTQQTTGTTDQIVSADMVDANVGYLTLNSSNRPIYKTTNGGTNWIAVTTPFTGNIKAVSAVDANLVYIGASSGTGTNRIGKSTDGGATWQQIALPATVDLTSMNFSDANTGYAVGNTSTALCRTIDGGATWSFQNAHVNAEVKIYAGPSGAAWALGTSASILRFNVLQPTSAVSRLTHGGAGNFDIDMPLTGTPGVECRNGGGNYTLVITFSNTMVSGNASVTAGAGSVAGSPTFSGHTMTINLTGVTNAQTLTVSLTNLTDSFAQVLPTIALDASFLVGDTSGNGSVNSTDIDQTKSQSGNAVTASNFREDVNVNGSINASDVGLVKSRSGTALP